MNASLVQKYNVPGPRYTSYPTVPYWDETFAKPQWEINVRRAYAQFANEGVSLYIHLPYCESMCTFCGCFKRITKNHKVEAPYIQAVLKEWRLYCKLLGEKPLVKEVHLGGGTPTFFSTQNLEDLINGIFATARKAPHCEMGFEGHPNSTTRDHLQKLYDLGFRRVSFGVQDYADEVQRAIHRIQPFVQVAKVTLWAREIGYTSISHDLVFGLPKQTHDHVTDTIEKTLALQPSRLAFYSYAHTPWIKGNGQRGYDERDLPRDAVKRQLYETGKMMLEEHGYAEIGMDHFALPQDPLFEAQQNGTLHRNFMGYGTQPTRLLIGLGASAISDSWYGFAQNVKSLEDYFQLLEWDQLPVVKGHTLTPQDLVVRQHILNLMCRFETSWEDPFMYLLEMPEILARLREMEADGLIAIAPDGIKVLEKGRGFVRNVCMAFDLRLVGRMPEAVVFSGTV